MVMPIRVKRIYEPADAGDGQRILVDRIWPRGISRERAELDAWMPDVAPSTDLRKWFDAADHGAIPGRRTWGRSNHNHGRPGCQLPGLTTRYPPPRRGYSTDRERRTGIAPLCLP